MIKLIASDIDGTLVNDKNQFAPDFFHVLKELNKRDIKFVAASGRSKYSLEKLFQPFQDRLLYISDNGAFVSDNQTEYCTHKLKKEDVECVVEELLKLKGIQIILCAKYKSYFVNFQPELLDKVIIHYNQYEIVENYKEIDDEFLKIAVYDPNGSEKYSCPIMQEKVPEGLCAIATSVPWLDIMDCNVNKGRGLRALQKAFDIAPGETMVFGDYFNDIEMFKVAEYSFAMENACNEVKQHCKFCAKSNNDFGVTEKIKEMVLLTK